MTTKFRKRLLKDLSELRTGIPILISLTTEAREIQYRKGVRAAVPKNVAAQEMGDDLITLITHLRIAVEDIPETLTKPQP